MFHPPAGSRVEVIKTIDSPSVFLVPADSMRPLTEEEREELLRLFPPSEFVGKSTDNSPDNRLFDSLDLFASFRPVVSKTAQVEEDDCPANRLLDSCFPF